MSHSRHPAELAEFPVVVRFPVQWGDQDAFGHVNNTIFIRWFETARIDYLAQPAVREALAAAGLQPILASVTCHFRRQVKFPDTMLIGARVSHVGRSSIVMEHAIYSEARRAIVADGQGVVVAYDYAANQSRRVPDNLRAIFDKLEGRTSETTGQEGTKETT